MSALDTQSSIATESSNLRDLFLLRCIAIGGQILIIWYADARLQLELPLAPLAIIVGLQVAWNLVTWLRLRDRRPIGRPEFFLQVLIDVAAVTGLLYFTGGATNPFAWIYLLPLMILTINLPRGYAWGMAGIAITAYTAMLNWHVPLPGTHAHHDSGFGLHIFGMWFGFVLSSVLMVHFVSHMARNLRQRDLHGDLVQRLHYRCWLSHHGCHFLCN